MANSVTTNPIYLDTFTADIVVKAPGTGPLIVKAITLWSDDSETRFMLEDGNGVPCAVLGRGTNGPQSVSFGNGTNLTRGVICDVSDCDKVSGKAKVCIYL